MLFEVEEEAIQSVLSMGGQVEVVEPASLRTQVIQQAEALARLYCIV